MTLAKEFFLPLKACHITVLADSPLSPSHLLYQVLRRLIASKIMLAFAAMPIRA